MAKKTEHSGRALSIVVPVYNSADCLENLVRETSRALAKISYELILVNDASRDKSWEIIESLASSHREIVGINLRKNSGQDNAIMAGLHYVHGDYTVIMDDDLQHNPQDIPRLYEAVREGYDICFANFRSKKQALWKNAGSWLNGKAAEIVIRKPAEIYLSPFKIIDSHVIREVVRYTGPFPYIDGLLFQYTSNVTQIDCDHHDRFSGSSNYNFIRSIKVFMKLATSFSTVPLKVSSVCGTVLSLAGVLLGIKYIVEYFISPEAPQGWTTIVVLVLFIGGMIMTSLGIIGEYLGRAYLNINGYPQFNVRDIVDYRSHKKTLH